MSSFSTQAFTGPQLVEAIKSEFTNMPLTMDRTAEYPAMFFHVKLVPPLAHFAYELIQTFDMPAPKAAMDIVHDPELTAHTTSTVYRIGARIGPSPKRGMPQDLLFPHMLYHDTMFCVLALYVQQDGAGSPHTRQWSEYITFTLPVEDFPEPPMPDIYQPNPAEANMLQCTIPLSQLFAERWIMDEQRDAILVYSKDAALALVLSISKVTRKDNATGLSTGQPMTLHQNRIYGLYGIQILMDALHAAPFM